jgi:hypothetical protein
MHLVGISQDPIPAKITDAINQYSALSRTRK